MIGPSHRKSEGLPVSESQDTCLYRRLNAALRNHGNRSLEPFLPYMKLLLSALYAMALSLIPNAIDTRAR